MGGSDGVPSPIPSDEVVERRPMGLDDGNNLGNEAHIFCALKRSCAAGLEFTIGEQL